GGGELAEKDDLIGAAFERAVEMHEIDRVEEGASEGPELTAPDAEQARVYEEPHAKEGEHDAGEGGGPGLAPAQGEVDDGDHRGAEGGHEGGVDRARIP